MSEAAAEFSQIPMSQNLAATLARASDAARAAGTGEVALEHVLFALCDDPDAQAVMAASHVDIAHLKADAMEFLRTLPVTAPGAQLVVSGSLTRILEAAAAAARGGRRRDINGAIVLAAIVGDGRSIAAQILQTRGLTFDEAIRALQAALAAPRDASPDLRPADDVLAQARERVQSRSAPSLRQMKGYTANHQALPPPPPIQPPMPEPAAGAAEPEPAADDAAPATDVAEDVAVEAETETGATEAGATEASPVPPPEADAEETPGEAEQHESKHEEPKPPKKLAEVAAPAAPSPPPKPAAPGYAYPAEGMAMPASKPRPPPAPGGTQAAPFDLNLPRPAPVATPPPLPPPPPIPKGLPGMGGPPGMSGMSGFPPPMRGAPPRGPQAPFPPPQGFPPPQPQRQQPPPQPGALRPPPPANAPYGKTGHATAPPTIPPQMRAPPQQGKGTPKPQRSAKAATELGQLAENIPRRMRVGVTERIEVRLAKASAKAVAEGLEGGGQAWVHQVTVAKAMSVRLRAPEGGFFIETASPETQWIENNLGFDSDDFASWRFLVTPQARGWANLQIIVSARTIGADGMAAETALPDQVVEVKVRTNYKRALLRWTGWILAAIAGGALARFGEGGFEMIEQFLQKFVN